MFNFIDPKILLTIVKNEIEKQLNDTIYEYKIVYNIKLEKLDFIVKGNVYKYDNKSVANTIRTLIEKKIKITNEFKAFVIEYLLDENDKSKVDVSLIIYTEKDKQKQVDKYEL